MPTSSCGYDEVIPASAPSAPEASPSDRELTARLAEALALVGVRLLDHFVIGDGRCASFAEMGLL